MHASEYEKLLNEILQHSTNVRYVALYQDGVLYARQRETVHKPSRADSDYYEEILVNPTLLLLASQRGNIDCGGLEGIVVEYGNFYQVIRHFHHGHCSACLEKSSDIQKEMQAIGSLLERWNC
jgi:hypothetical protein